MLTLNIHILFIIFISIIYCNAAKTKVIATVNGYAIETTNCKTCEQCNDVTYTKNKKNDPCYKAKPPACTNCGCKKYYTYTCYIGQTLQSYVGYDNSTIDGNCTMNVVTRYVDQNKALNTVKKKYPLNSNVNCYVNLNVPDICYKTDSSSAYRNKSSVIYCALIILFGVLYQFKEIIDIMKCDLKNIVKNIKHITNVLLTLCYMWGCILLDNMVSIIVAIWNPIKSCVEHIFIMLSFML